MTVGQGLKLLAIVDHTILATTTCMTITYLSPTDADLKTAPFFEKVMT